MNIFSSTTKILYLIISSFFVAMVLMFLRMPFGFNWFGSFWLVLILLYWALMMPQYINIGVAWFVGLFFDIAYRCAIGEHAMALIIVVFFITKFRHIIIPLGYWKNSLIVLGLIMLYQFLLFLMQSYEGEYLSPWSILGGAIVSALIWPFLALLLFNCQQKLYSG